ncbi:ribulose-phosphate 3-epimerase [Staphylococcus sp. 11261D007BR]
MTKVFPSLLSVDFLNLKQELQQLEAAKIDGLHFDVMDGQFVPNISIGFPILESIRPITTLPIDVHLMIESPEDYIELFCNKGADKISVHIESTPHIHRAIQKIKAHQVQAGVVINPGTSVHAIEAILNEVDYVLVMSVNPGFGGQSFIDSTLDKIKYLDQLRRDHNYKYKIEVDGGINAITAPKVIQSGADWLVAGSYFFQQQDYQEAVNTLKSEV